MANKEAVINALAKEWHTGIQTENEFTTSDMSRALSQTGTSLSRGEISRKMKKLIDDGVLQSRRVKRKDGSGSCNAYSPVEGKSWEDVLQYIKKK